MKKLTWILAGLLFLSISSCSKKDTRPRVIITTDIQVCCGDPDDVQSLCHVLWYADELDIRAIIPEKFGRGDKPGGITAAEEVIEHYRSDFLNPSNKFQDMGFPNPDYFLNEALQTHRDSSINKIIKEAYKKDKRPLYILVWGNMTIIKDALLKDPEIADKIRVLSIGTNLKAPLDGGDGAIPNWNGPGRNRIFGDPKFDELWWIENDWGYNGMFHGLEYPEDGGRPISGRPREVLVELAESGGNLGQHMKEAVSSERVKWAYYFRVGDTPTALYLLDPDNDPNDPSLGSWAGIFEQPFSESRPNYWTNVTGDCRYDHTNPLVTWRSADSAIVASCQYLIQEREEMYEAMLSKVRILYGE